MSSMYCTYPIHCSLYGGGGGGGAILCNGWAVVTGSGNMSSMYCTYTMQGVIRGGGGGGGGIDRMYSHPPPPPPLGFKMSMVTNLLHYKLITKDRILDIVSKPA